MNESNENDAGPLKRIVGYQIGDSEGWSIQGDDDDPFDLPSFFILTGAAAEAAERWVERNPGYVMLPIKDGDIEEPEFISELPDAPKP